MFTPPPLPAAPHTRKHTFSHLPGPSSKSSQHRHPGHPGPASGGHSSPQLSAGPAHALPGGIGRLTRGLTFSSYDRKLRLEEENAVAYRVLRVTLPFELLTQPRKLSSGPEGALPQQLSTA
jgi:hypothetical protein